MSAPRARHVSATVAAGRRRGPPPGTPPILLSHWRACPRRPPIVAGGGPHHYHIAVLRHNGINSAIVQGRRGNKQSHRSESAPPSQRPQLPPVKDISTRARSVDHICALGIASSAGLMQPSPAARTMSGMAPKCPSQATADGPSDERSQRSQHVTRKILEATETPAGM